jgi:hypothetical protein
LALLLIFSRNAPGAAPIPVIFQTAPGRFEVAAVDTAAAHAVIARAEEVWRLLAEPLALPESFSSPVFIRLVPGEGGRDAEPFRIVVEPGGVVSVRLSWQLGAPDDAVRRALVRGLLLRLAVARHGVAGRVGAPFWLEEACIGWWRTRAEAAQLDALKQESARLRPPPLEALLGWRTAVDGTPPQNLVAGAVWLFTVLQAESGRAGEWLALLDRVLAGAETSAALATCYPGRFADDAGRELWWQTGWHHFRVVRNLPTLEAEESRRALDHAARFVFAVGVRDTVLPLRAVLERAGEPAVRAELSRRAVELDRLLPALHPFYRNAGLSLAEALRAPAAAAVIAARCAAFERDWREAVELDEATTAALDRLEKTSSPGGQAPP